MSQKFLGKNDWMLIDIFCRTPDPWRLGRTVKPYLHNKELKCQTLKSKLDLDV
ncbi:hypothetical protein C1646_765546 [Rhizophagus diaphanus]|nr:hypothetical protein C1646_765546 [Rhizophagus diaphanus] [Rhizophagus sp. MUCL 43196]